MRWLDIGEANALHDGGAAQGEDQSARDRHSASRPATSQHRWTSIDVFLWNGVGSVVETSDRCHTRHGGRTGEEVKDRLRSEWLGLPGRTSIRSHHQEIVNPLSSEEDPTGETGLSGWAGKLS